MKVLFLTRYGRLGASSRLRAQQFYPWLESASIECLSQPLFSDELLSARYRVGGYSLNDAFKAYLARLYSLLRRNSVDLVWIEKEALPWLPVWVEKLLLNRTKYVLDFDDAVFHNYDLHRSAVVRRVLGRRIDHLMAGADLITAGNAYLAQRALDAGARHVQIIPTVIDLERYPFQVSGNSGLVPRVVWIGSPSTVRYLAMLAEPLAELAGRRKFILRVIGGELAMPGVDVECVRWTEDTEVSAIRECDIGIMPLTDSPWERGKCGYKLIQYMACGLPVVATPVGVNAQIVREGVNGYLADTAAVWVARLDSLIADQALRSAMGETGRRFVEEQYCTQVIGPQMIHLLRKTAEKN